MRSKLYLFGRALIETAWLAAAAIIPLFFNISSLQVFEPDKVSILKFLTIISIGAFLLIRISEGLQNLQLQVRSFIRNPLVKPIIILGALYLLSTVLSIAPSVSFWGSYRRAQGLVTFFCYFILFLTVISELRTSDQLKRLQFVILLTSLPVSVYAILQALGIDSLPWNGMFERSSGSAGNPIFLGAYLIMIIPLTFCRLVEGWKAFSGGKRKPGLVIFVFCSITLLLQCIALVCTQSRGPVLGLIVAAYLGFFVFLVMHRATHVKGLVHYAIVVGLGLLGPVFLYSIFRFASEFSARAAWTCALAAVAAVAAIYIFLWRTPWGRGKLWLGWFIQSFVLLVLFAYPAGVVPKGAGIASSFGRMAQLSDGSVDVRRSLWATEIRFLRSNPPAVLPGGMRDPVHALRRAIGYGPECVWLATNFYAVPQLVTLTPDENSDRMHNELFDHLVEIGFAGALAFLFVISAGIYYSLRYLGFIPGRREKIAFVLLLCAGCLAGFLGPVVFKASHLAGVGSELGLVGGVFLFIAWNGFRNSNNQDGIRSRQWLVLGILGALIAHFLETAVGIACTPTELYLFLFMALLSVFSTRDLTQKEEPSKKAAVKRVRWFENPILPYAMLSGFIILVESWSFAFNSEYVRSAQEVFSRTWFGFSFDTWQIVQFPCGLVILLLTIGGMVGAAYSERDDIQLRPSGSRNPFKLCLILALALWIVMGLLSANSWTGLSGRSSVEVAMNTEARITLFIVALSILMVGTAILIMPRHVELKGGKISTGMRGMVLCAALGICVILGAWEITLRPEWADIGFRIGDQYEQKGNLIDAAQIYKRASELAPWVIPYRLSLGMAQGTAGLLDEVQQNEAASSIESARAINPLDFTVYRTLGSLYEKIAESSRDPRIRATELTKAIASFQKVSELVPIYPTSYSETGRCFFILGDYERANGLYQKSLRLNPDYWRTYMFLGEMSYKLKDLEGALHHFENSVRRNGNNVEGQKNVGLLLSMLGRREEAIRTDLNLLEKEPRDPLLLTRLSVLYFKTGNYNAGIDFARRAYDVTPGAGRSSLDQFIEQLKNAN